MAQEGAYAALVFVFDELGAERCLAQVAELDRFSAEIQAEIGREKEERRAMRREDYIESARKRLRREDADVKIHESTGHHVIRNGDALT